MEEKHGASSQSSHPTIDIRLQALLEADDEQYQILLDNLIKEHAEPLVHKIIHSKLAHGTSSAQASHNDANDLCQDAITKLISYLTHSRTSSSGLAIRAFDDFVAKITFNVYNNYVRSQYPQRYKLKRRLEYQLKSRKEFDLWKEASEQWAGLADWRNSSWDTQTAPAVIQPQSFPSAQFGETPRHQVPLFALLMQVFEWAKNPIAFDRLVDFVAEFYGIKDFAAEDWLGNNKQSYSEQKSGDETQKLEYRERLRFVWREIQSLPIRQRYALLLNWKSNAYDSVLHTLITWDLATLQTIAEALEMEPSDLERIWNSLPLKDSTIGDLLGGLSIQTVINLRKSARERLVRRLRKPKNQLPKL